MKTIRLDHHHRCFPFLIANFIPTPLPYIYIYICVYILKTQFAHGCREHAQLYMLVSASQGWWGYVPLALWASQLPARHSNTTSVYTHPSACVTFWAGEVPPVLPQPHSSRPAESGGSWAGAAVGWTFGSGAQDGAGCPLGQALLPCGAMWWLRKIPKAVNLSLEVESRCPVLSGLESSNV